MEIQQPPAPSQQRYASTTPQPMSDIPPVGTAVGRQAPTVIGHSLRSGQQVYAQNGDLIIMGNVHSGAEAVSDGNIFIFGALKGRALAGVSGDRSAKIIVNKFQAELVSIGPAYHACETIPRTVNPTTPTTISLGPDDKLHFTSSAEASS
eukprot:gene7359-8572_t